MNQQNPIPPVTFSVPTAPPKSCGMATASLVCGIISLIGCAFFTGIPAIILGIKARTKIKDSRGVLTGDGTALAGLITGIIGTASSIFTIAILAGLLLPAIGMARERANRVSCMSNMKQLGLACKAYATDDEQVRLPLTFKLLTPAGNQNNPYITDPRVFICPSSGHQAGNLADVDSWSDYQLVAAGKTDSACGSETPLLVEKPENHHGKLGNTLYGDGHVSGRIIKNNQR